MQHTIRILNHLQGTWVSSPKDTVFPETIPEESSSTEEEHVVIFRLPSLHESDGFLRDPSIYTVTNFKVFFGYLRKYVYILGRNEYHSTSNEKKWKEQQCQVRTFNTTNGRRCQNK